MPGHRTPTYPSNTYHSLPPRVVAPGLSRYNSPPIVNQPSSYRNNSYNTTTTGSSRPRHSKTYYNDYHDSYPKTSKPEKGLSYTSTRDLGGWLGGAALTAGAAYLLRGSNGAVYGNGRDARKSRERERDRYYEDKYYDGRDRGRGRDRHSYDDYDGYGRGKSSTRTGGERARAKSERRGGDGGRDRRSKAYYYY